MQRDTFHRLQVRQKGIVLVKLVYELSSDFPSEEIYGLTTQMRRAAISIPSHIAEGNERTPDAEFVYFLERARGSVAELYTQRLISNQLGYVKDAEKSAKILSLIDEQNTLLLELIKAYQ